MKRETKQKNNLNNKEEDIAMVSEKIACAAIALQELAGKVKEEDWEFVSIIRKELLDALEVSRRLEKALLPVEKLQEVAS